jgi:Tfp pilus assembly protein PilZ
VLLLEILAAPTELSMKSLVVWANPVTASIEAATNRVFFMKSRYA